ncbi:MAG: hypothetical protein J6I49_06570 [Bacteroidales bacterium]|nr:hypothetical protein [Bacteroidales bacterium]
MRRYYLALVACALVLTLAAFAVMWLAPQAYLGIMPLLALYFAAVTGVQHFFVLTSMYQSARRFVQVFLAVTVAVLFVHLAVFAAYLFTHPAQAKPFAVAFLVGFAATLVFETTALVLHIRRERRRTE